MTSEELRLECAKLAVERLGDMPGDVTELAREIASFVEGTDDAKVVRAAREFQQKVAT